MNSTRAKELLDEIKALKDKTEMNRAQGKEAKDAANAALDSAKDVEKVSLTSTNTYIYLNKQYVGCTNMVTV